MTDLERLTALLDNAPADPAGNRNVRTLAEYLLANGVVVPPCKVGDTVYELKENGKIVKGIAQSIHQNLVGKEQGRWIVTSWFDDYYADSKEAGFECGTHLYSSFTDLGKTVFLTREEAERALKGGDS